MNFWVISPNVSANAAEQPLWEKAIDEKGIAIMGWDEDHSLGSRFIDDIKIGDFILIAQGANRQKRIFLGGIVSSDAIWEKIDDKLQEAYYRKLNPILRKEELDSMSLNFKGSAFGDADRIPALYILHPYKNEADKKIADSIATTIIIKLQNMELQNKIKLLEYKKQIILQGPPGTGKTRMAKEIARRLCLRLDISEDQIRQLIYSGLIIRSAKDYVDYKIVGLDDSVIKIQNESRVVSNSAYSDIIQSYENKTWLTGSILNGSQSFAAAIAKYIYEHLEVENSKLIQFHPAYSYEDFVRGITAKLNGTQVEYKSENKVLADFALKALTNFNDSKKNKQTLSKEKWLLNELQLFGESIQENIDREGKYAINETVSIFAVEEDAFRYCGNTWTVDNKQRMKFGDIALSYLNNAQNRQDIKIIPGISGRAREHSSYDFKLLEKFRTFLNTRPAFGEQNIQVSLQNFVLIIDEINRANLPAVLGELIYALEYRGEAIDSMYDLDGDKKITLPPNLYVIGTMNTADRSVGHIDYAIRRRFGFVDIDPSPDVIKIVVPEENGLRDKALKLFADVALFFTTDKMASDFKAKDIQLGHSYFLAKTENELSLKLEFEIKPLLKEYIKDGILISNKNGNGIDLTEQDIDNLKIA